MEDFFRDLRALRIQAGLSIDELAERAHFPADTITAAETGPEVPPNPVIVAFVRACGGPVGEWEDRWRAAVRNARAAATLAGRDNDTQAETKARTEPPAAASPRSGRRQGRLSSRLAVGLSVAALLAGGSVALLARQAGHTPPRAAPAHTPEPPLRPAPAPSRSPEPRVAVWPEVAGVGCPDTSRAAVTLDAATQGPAWQGAGGGWASNGCDGSSVWTMNPNGRELRPSALSWSFTPQGRVSACTLSVFVPAQNALGQAGYSINEGPASFGSVTIDQATVAGQWITLGTFPAAGPAVEITLMPVVASLTALDYGLGPGRPPYGHNTAVAASAAAMTCA